MGLDPTIDVTNTIKRLPSTTEILKTFGFYSYLDVAGYANSEVGKNRGSAVDKAVTYLAMGQEPVWKETDDIDRLLYRDTLNSKYLNPVRKFLIQHEWIHHSHQ